MDKEWKATIKTGTSGSRQARVCMCVCAFLAVEASVALGPHNLKGSVADVASLQKPGAVSQPSKAWGVWAPSTNYVPSRRPLQSTDKCKAEPAPSVEKEHALMTRLCCIVPHDCVAPSPLFIPVVCVCYQQTCLLPLVRESKSCKYVR